MDRVYEYIEANWRDAIDDLKSLLSQPSISAQEIGIPETATLTAELLRDYGVPSQIMPTNGGAPMVYGELKGDSPFTLLFYNHYDVQPPEPLELWITPPFEPSIVDGKLFARGVSDDKGDIIARLLAIKAFLQERGTLPISIKFLIEGEREIGSRLGEGAGCVSDDNPGGVRSFNVDIVVADPEVGDDLQACCSCDHFGVDPLGQEADERFGSGDLR